MGHKRRRLPSRGSIVLIEEDLIADHRGSPAGPHHDWIGIRRGRCPWLQEDLTSSKRASSRRPANGQRLTGYVVLPEKWISRVARHVQEPPSGAETCSCTTIQPCARFSRTIVHRPSKCDDAPCLLTRSAPNVTVAHANDPRRCTARSSFSRNLMLRFGSKSAFCARPVLRPIVVFQRHNVEIGEACICGVVRLNLSDIQTFPGPALPGFRLEQ